MANWWNDDVAVATDYMKESKGKPFDYDNSPVTEWPEFKTTEKAQWWEEDSSIGSPDEIMQEAPQIIDNAAVDEAVKYSRDLTKGSQFQIPQYSEDSWDFKQPGGERQIFNYLADKFPELSTSRLGELSDKVQRFQRIASVLSGDVEFGDAKDRRVTVKHKKDASSDVANEILGPLAPSLTSLGPDDRQLFLRVFQDYMADRGQSDRSAAGNFYEQAKRGYQDVLNSTTLAAGNTLGVLPENASEDDVFMRQIRGIREGLDPGLSSGILRGPQMATRMAPAAALGAMASAPGAAIAAEFGIVGIGGAILKGGGPAAFWYAQTQPGLYAELRGEGIDRDIAMQVSQVASVPIALVEQFNDIGGNFTKASLDGAKQAATRSVTKFLKSQAKESGKQFGAEFSEEFGQALLEVSAKAVADHLDEKNPGINWRKEMEAKASELGDAAIALPFMMAPASAINTAGGLANTLANKEAYKQAKLQQSQPTAAPASAGTGQPTPPVDFSAAINQSVDDLWANNPDLAKAIVSKIADGGRISRTDWAKAREVSPTLPNKVSSNARDEFAKALTDRQPKTQDAVPSTPAETPTEAAPPIAEAPTTDTTSDTSTESGLSYEEFAQQYSDAFANSQKYAPGQVGSREFIDQMATLADKYPDFLDRLEKSITKPSQPDALESVTPQVADGIRNAGDPIEDQDRNDTGWVGQRTPTGMVLVHPGDAKVKRFDTTASRDFPSTIAAAREWAANNPVKKITPRVEPKVEKPVKVEETKKTFKKPAQPTAAKATTADEFTSYLEGMALAEEGRQKDPNFPRVIDRVEDGRGRKFSIRKTPKNGWTVVEHDPSGAEIEEGGDPRGGGYSKQEAIKAAVAKARFPASMKPAESTDSKSDVPSVPSKEVTNGQEEANAQGQTRGRQEGLLGPGEAPAAGDTTAPAPKPASVQDAGEDYAAKLRDRMTQRLSGETESQAAPEPAATSNTTPAAKPKPKRKFKKASTPPAASTEAKPDQQAAEPPAKPADTPIPQTEQDRLRAELAAKAKKFADAARSKLYSNPLDPELIGLAADMTLTAVKLGAVKFKAFVKEMADTLGREMTAKSSRYLRAAWDIIREDFPDAKLDASSDVDSVLQELADEKREPAQEPRVGDGVGESQPNAPEVSGRTPQETGSTGEGSRDTGGNVLPDANATAGGEPERGGSQPTGDREGSLGPGESGVAGSGAAEPRGGEGTQSVLPKDGDASVDTQNHVIGPDDVLAVGSEIQSIKNNIAAIELLQTLERESRYATPEEKKTLARFVGWGKLSNAFNRYKGEAMTENRKYGRDPAWEKKWGQYYVRLKELMTEDEWIAARDSTINAHYTSRAVIEKMWGLARSLGFKGGRVLEPGAGIGHFAGLVPGSVAADTKFVLVERDQFSARMLGKLYPQADVMASAMEDAKLSPASVDMVIGNVPFAKTVPSDDPQRRYGMELNLHNYFIARSLDAVKPGGLVVVISTHNTMDSAVEQRKLLASKGDLIGAIRLPNNAFDENAGTEVVTDILVLRRPINDERIGQAFTNTVELELPAANDNLATDRVNEYFVANPEMVLGKQTMTGKMYKNNREEAEYTVVPTPGNLSDKIQAAIDRMPRNVMSQDAASGDVIDINSALEKREGYLSFDGDKLMMAVDGKWKQIKPGESIENYPKNLTSASGISRARDYIDLRDTYAKVREVMLAPESTDEQIAAQQKALNKSYDAYVKKHGYVSEQKTAIFANDPEYYRILSLENEKASYNPQTKKIEYTYSKAAVFTTRTLGPRMPPTSTDTIKDSLWVSLGYRGAIDIPYMAELTGKTQAEVAKSLADEGLAFRDPANQQWTLRERYLSGNVKRKLQAAEVAAADDPAYQANVDALKQVQPAPVAINNVGVELGANWITPEVLTFFTRQLFGDPKAIVTYNPHADSFEAEINKSLTSVTNKYAVKNANDRVTGGHKIFNSIINMRSPKITKLVDTGEVDQQGKSIFREEPDEKATVAAAAIAQQMQDEFRKLVSTNRQVAQVLEAVYNEKFNAYVDAKYDGSHLEMPGASPSIKLRPYQKNAIWRILQDGSAMLAHAVGAGKTFTMIGAAMEMRRLRLAKRPMIVVQNATLGQFATSFLRMYPNANVLVASKDDLAFKNRQKFLARITSGNWDAIVVAQSTFDNLSSKPEVEQQFIRDKLDELEELINDEGGERAKTPTVKDLVRARNSLQKQLDKLLDKQTKNAGKDLVYFEDLDVDALFIDEAHAYKKPFFLTKMENLVGLNKQASTKGVMTSIKIKTVQDKNGGKNVVLATGTPITNTLGEAWHMVNFVSPRVNEDFGSSFFDGFVGAFAKKETVRTQNAGGQWVFKDALTKFKNGPELIRYIRAAWDILSPDDLRAYMDETDQALPKLKTGKVQAVTVDRTPNVEKFQDFLNQVYTKFKGLKGKEKRQWSFIPAVAYGASKAAALDIRLVFPNAAEEAGNKVTAAADRVYQDYVASQDVRGTQLVFSDTFNPRSMDALYQFMAGEEVDLRFETAPMSADEENNLEANSFLFADLRKKLIARGIPANEIAIVAEAKTDAQREALFDRVKAGDVRVLIGSTSKMGVGVNVQDRLTSLHHLDAPWMPMEVEQREGRIIRFGNINKEVSIYRYAMSNTLDGAIFASIARKSKFIWQVLSGKVEGREFDDPASEFTMSIDEQIAAIEGDPLLFERMDLDRESRELELQREAFYDAIARNQEYITQYTAEVNRYQKQVIPKRKERLKAVKATPIGEEPSVAIGGKTLTDPEAIDSAVKDLLEAHEKSVVEKTKADKLEARSIIQSKALWEFPGHQSEPVTIGPFEARFVVGAFQKMVEIDGKVQPGPLVPSIEPAIYLPSEPRVNLYAGSAKTGVGLFNAAKSLVTALDNAVTQNEQYAAQKQKEIEELTAMNEGSWPHEQRLSDVKARLKAIEAEIVAASAAKTKAKEDKAKEEKARREQQRKENDDDQEISPDDVGDPGMPMMPAHQNIATAVTSTGPNMPQSINGAPSPKVRPIAVTEVIRAIRDATSAFGKDIPFRVGRISKPNALGVFQVFPEIVRLRIANDISTAAHELGHAIEKLSYGWKKGGPWNAKLVGRRAVKELMKLGKDLYPNKNPVGGWKREGFAEYAKFWITDPAYAKSKAPEFTKWFESEFLAKSPAGKLALERAQSAAARYIGQTEFDRGDTGIVDRTGLVEGIKSLGRFIRDTVSFQSIVEEGAPLRDAERSAEIASQKTRGRGLSLRERPYFLFSALRGTAAAKVKYMVESAMIDMAGNEVTGIKPLNEIRKLVPKSKSREWIVYMWAKRAQALLEDPRGPRNPGMTLADAKSIIAQSETPQFAEAAEIFYAWNNGVLDYAASASPTLAEAVNKIRARDPGFYIPLKREFDELERLYTSSNDKSVTAGSLAGKLKGSGRRILHPIQQAITQAQQVVEAAHDRAVLEAVLRLDRIEGMGEHVVRVPRDKIPVAKKDLSELIETVQKRLERQNIELYDQNGDPIDATNHAGELVTFFAFARQPKAGESIIPVWNAKTNSVSWYEVNPSLYQAMIPNIHRLDGFGKFINFWIGKPMRFTAQTLRLGATGLSAPFAIVTNTIRDARTLAKNSRGTHNFVRAYYELSKMMLPAIADAITDGKISNKYIRFYNRMGGRMAQSLQAQSGSTKRVAEQIFGRRVQFIPTWREALSWFEDVLQFSDTAARATEIKLVSEREGIDITKPLSLEDALHLLLSAKQVTTDFSATGSITKSLGQYIPFLRSGIQGPRAAARAFARAPAAYLLKGMATSAMAAALWYALKDEEWWEEVDPNDKLRYFFIPVTINGRKEIVQIPVNQDADFVFGTGFIAALDSLYRDNPKAAKEWAVSFVEATTPVSLPPIADEIRDQLGNEDSFTGKPIVPDEYKDRKPEQQYSDRTPELTKWIGEKTGLSPMRLEHAVTGLTGSVGRGAVKLASSAMTGELSGTSNESEPSDIPVAGRMFKRGGPLGFQPRTVSEFYDLSRKAEQVKEDIKTPETDAHKERRLVLEDAKKALGAISAISRVAKTVDEQRDLARQKVAIAKRAIELYQSPNEPDRPEMAAMRKAYEYRAAIAAGETAKAKKMFENLKDSAASKPSPRKKLEPTSKYRARIADHERESASARAALRVIRGG